VRFFFILYRPRRFFNSAGVPAENFVPRHSDFHIELGHRSVRRRTPREHLGWIRQTV